MTIDLNMETLNSLGKTAEAITPTVQPEGVGETFEQRALYWVNIINQMFSSLNQLLDNVKSNPLIAQQLSDRFGFKFPANIGQPSVPAQISSQTPLTISKGVDDNPLFAFLNNFLKMLTSRGLGKLTVKEFFNKINEWIEKQKLGTITIEQMYKDTTEHKDYLNEIFKKLTEKKDDNRNAGKS